MLPRSRFSSRWFADSIRVLYGWSIFPTTMPPGAATCEAEAVILVVAPAKVIVASQLPLQRGRFRLVETTSHSRSAARLLPPRAKPCSAQGRTLFVPTRSGPRIDTLRSRGGRFLRQKESDPWKLRCQQVLARNSSHKCRKVGVSIQASSCRNWVTASIDRKHA